MAITNGISWDDAIRPLRQVSYVGIMFVIAYIAIAVLAVLNAAWLHTAFGVRFWWKKFQGFGELKSKRRRSIKLMQRIGRTLTCFYMERSYAFNSLWAHKVVSRIPRGTTQRFKKWFGTTKCQLNRQLCCAACPLVALCWHLPDQISWRLLDVFGVFFAGHLPFLLFETKL